MKNAFYFKINSDLFAFSFHKGGTGGSKPNAVVKEPTAIEKFEVAIKQVKIAHPRNIFLDKA